MSKIVSDFTVSAVERPRLGYAVLKLRYEEGPLPSIMPGQFVEILVEKSKSTFLRRPISVNFVDIEKNEVWILVHAIGEGTRAICQLEAGDKLNMVLPLGNGFTMHKDSGRKILLVGGGVGTAPLLYYGKLLSEAHHEVTFLLGGRTSADILQMDLFKKIGRLCTTTEDGSLGEEGFVTQHSVWNESHFDNVATCGPKPMMVAVSRICGQNGIDCEVSLENMMACGLGACLCCVEKNIEGHNVCVCKEGPVFNTKSLRWHD